MKSCKIRVKDKDLYFVRQTLNNLNIHYSFDKRGNTLIKDIRILGHFIGFDNRHPKQGKIYKPSRNYYYTGNYEEMRFYCESGVVDKVKDGYYRLNENGFKFLEKYTGLKIKRQLD